MKGAFGALNWTPEVFWASTLTEFVIAFDGFNEAHGAQSKPDAPTESEMDELLRKYG